MKILIVSLLKRSVSASTLSSRPRIIYELTRGLVQKGHDVTFMGTGDSNIEGAKMISVIPQAYSLLPPTENPLYSELSYLIQLEKQLEKIGSQFDIIHNHTYPEFLNLFATEKFSTPFVTTIHAQGTPELDDVLSLFPKTYYLSISKAHQMLFNKTKIYKVVYNGIDTSIYTYQEKKEDYLLWLGRLAKAKNADGSFMDPKGIRWAIQLAEETGQRLLLSGNIEDMNFYKKDVEPHLNDKIKWIGPLTSNLSLSKPEVAKLMQNAKAFLMTINWYEPFGLVMAESMACGTPVIGFNRGAVPEIIKNGVTGFVVDPTKGIRGLKDALKQISIIRPADCRHHIEEHFSTQTMINNYEAVYKEIISNPHE